MGVPAPDLRSPDMIAVEVAYQHFVRTGKEVRVRKPGGKWVEFEELRVLWEEMGLCDAVDC